MYTTLEELRSDLGTPATSAVDAAYARKMLHPVTASRSVDRTKFIVDRCAGKRVLEFGASGPLHTLLTSVATVVGVDREASPGVVAFDLDDVTQVAVPHMASPDVLLCGEVLEHLSNPGWFLTRLRRDYPDVPLMVTVPNAFSQVAKHHIVKGTENVNRDHVAWYSYRTVRTLLERVGYRVAEHYWYNGPPYLAEGLIVIAV